MSLPIERQPAMIGLIFTILIYFAAGCGKSKGQFGASLSATNSDILASGTPINQFLVFDSDGDALTWFAGFRPVISLLQGDPGNPIDMTDFRVQRLDALVKRLWQDYQTRFPLEVGAIPAPRVILLNNGEKNAFAAFDPRVNLEPNVFFVNTGIIKGNFENEAEIIGVMAHELSHHVHRHGDPNRERQTEKFYFLKANNESLGALQANDASLEQPIRKWRTYANLIGDLSDPSTSGMPLGAYTQPLFEQVLFKTLSQHTSDSHCIAALGFLAAAQTRISKDLITFDESLNIGSADEAFLSQLGTTYKENLTKCLASETTPWLELIGKQLGLGRNDIENEFGAQFLDDNDRNLLVEKRPEGETLLTIFDDLSSKMREVEESTNLSKVRFYSTEEQADDDAVTALLDIGETSTALTNFLLDTLVPEQRAKCRALLASGQVPPYGSLADEHHATCYRVYHAGEFEKYLASTSK